jgi:hypothetical protein
MRPIPLDELVLTFTDTLNEVNGKLEAQHHEYQERVKTQYGAWFVPFSHPKPLHIKSACIKVAVKPVVKEERVDGVKVSKTYLMFGSCGSTERLNIKITIKE